MSYNDLGLLRLGFEHSIFCMYGERSNRPLYLYSPCACNHVQKIVSMVFVYIELFLRCKLTLFRSVNSHYPFKNPRNIHIFIQFLISTLRQNLSNTQSIIYWLIYGLLFSTSQESFFFDDVAECAKTRNTASFSNVKRVKCVKRLS